MQTYQLIHKAKIMDGSRTRRRGEIDTSAGAQPSVTACLRCREQKLKCGREQPVCARCQRLNTPCSYPLPPNRRGPRTPRGPRAPNGAAGRSGESTRPRRAVVQQPSSETSSRQTPIVEAERPDIISRDQIVRPIDQDALSAGNAGSRSNVGVENVSAMATGTTVLSDSYPNHLRTMSAIETEPTQLSGSDQPPLPPTALGLSLLELYFTRVYNASLMFHKTVLFQQYLEQELHGALLRALLALATLFLQPRAPEHEQATSDGLAELKILSIYHPCGLPWARAAQEEAMALAMNSPSLMVIQALECLQLYWIGIGQPYRANLCLALAYRACHLLGYSKKIPGDISASDLSLEAELGRRCFWACWTSTCIIVEPEPYVKASWQEVSMVPLPGLIRNTPSGFKVTVSERMDEDWHSSCLTSGTSTGSRPGATALLMKMVGVWAKVQLLCKENTASPSSRNFESGERLSQLSTVLFEEALSLRNSDYGGHQPLEDDRLLLVHDSLYHQCQISIHSMIVPVFSGIPSDPHVDLAKCRESASLVAKHADLFQRLLEPYFRGQRHISCLPPLVGYGSFVAGIVLLTVHISYANSEGNEFPEEADGSARRLASVEGILGLLDGLRVYWRALQRPWEILQTALQTDFLKHSRQDRPTDSRHDNVLTHPDHHENFDTPSRSSRTANISREGLESSGTGNSSATQDTSVLADPGDNGIQAVSMMGEGDPVISEINMPQDYDWYSLSFAEAGVEQFAGFEPYTLFQQGWQTFG